MSTLARLKYEINLSFQTLKEIQVDPWLFMPALNPFEIQRFNGKKIRYGGVSYERSPAIVFWSPSYIPPFLKDITVKSFDRLADFFSTSDKNFTQVRNEICETLKDGYLLIYKRMSEIDRLIRGKGYPEGIAGKNVEQYVEIIVTFMDSVKPIKNRRDRLEWQGKAMLLVRDRPEMSDRAIAQKVRINPSQLSRCGEYQKAAALSRGRKEDRIPRGFVIKSEAGLSDVEAYSDKNDPAEVDWDE